MLPKLPSFCEFESEEDLEDLEPEDLAEVPEPDLPDADFPEDELPALADGDVPEPDLVFEPEDELRLLPEEEDFEPVFEAEEVGLLLSLLPCISPEDIEEAALPMPDWPEPDFAFELESEPEPDIEDCPEFF